MFESDDFDQVLSQFDFPDDVTLKSLDVNNAPDPVKKQEPIMVRSNESTIKGLPAKENSPKKSINHAENSIKQTTQKAFIAENMVSPKHTKRKMLHSYFDHKSKRKFPGPAGLLTGGFEENKDETICQMELLSQDVDFSQHFIGDLFESPLWARLQDDLSSWNLNDVDSIKSIKQQALTGNLRRRKAHTVTAFVETIDRSATDPLVLMRDKTGSIKGTLHRDAWTAFSQYIASECCALILQTPTILTTGSAFKKHYLNITLSNILAIYSATVIRDETESQSLPDNYTVVYEEDFTVIKTEKSLQNIGNNFTLSDDTANGSTDLFEGLDSMFSDETF